MPRWQPETIAVNDDMWRSNAMIRKIVGVAELTNQYRANPSLANQTALNEMRRDLNLSTLRDREYFVYQLRHSDPMTDALVIGNLRHSKDRHRAFAIKAQHIGRIVMAKNLLCPPDPTSDEPFRLYLEAVMPGYETQDYRGRGIYVPIDETKIYSGQVTIQNVRAIAPSAMFDPRPER